MALFEDLQWMEEELLEDEEFDEEEEYEEEPPRRRWGRKARRDVSVSMDDREAVFVEKRKREKGIGKWKFLALLELLAILAVIWGWIKWLY